MFCRGEELRQTIVLSGALASLVLAGLLAAEVVAHGVIAGQMSGWAAPFGITLVADYLAAAMVTITAIIGLAVAVRSLAEIGQASARFGYYALLQTLLGYCALWFGRDLIGRNGDTGYFRALLQGFVLAAYFVKELVLSCIHVARLHRATAKAASSYRHHAARRAE
ncbi:hypothetical protein NOF55_08340 [Rhizobiaceae bacterium BDR2-2]|uniref:Uncharacterized protein n=1 Tax=Ectorhizobium quercum TaxID=2965071 RepID=A0AAE3MY52_9HYPH|nr:hypothetical protein [Ectorhizobium quercum]MCX8997114.1 hypothetical protein [Ectorhizobium quercum]